MGNSSLKKQTGTDKNRQEQTGTDRNRQDYVSDIENYCIIRKFIYVSDRKFIYVSDRKFKSKEQKGTDWIIYLT